MRRLPYCTLRKFSRCLHAVVAKSETEPQLHIYIYFFVVVVVVFIDIGGIFITPKICHK